MLSLNNKCQFKTISNSQCARRIGPNQSYCWQHLNSKQIKNPRIVSRVIAFDFDLTILKTHSIMNDWTPELVNHMSVKQIINATSPLFNHSKFIQLLKIHHQRGNSRFIITSYGSKTVIIAFLKRLGIFDLFDQVLTPSSFGLIDGYNVTVDLNGKNRMLERIETSYHLTRNRILLIDDSPDNIQQAQKAKYLTIQVDRVSGLKIKDGLLIQKFLDYQYH